MKLVIDIPDKIYKFIKDRGHLPYAVSLANIIEDGIPYEEKPKGEWIPVTERLPEECEPVLCWYEYFRYGDYNCMYETYGVGFHVHGYWTGDVTGHKAKVFAWMPLPEPYKRGDV